MLAEPKPSWLTQPFWDAANRHVLVRPVCTACGTNFFSPEVACPSCLSEAWTWEPSSGEGEIYSAVEGLPEVLDSMVVDLEYLGRASYMPLFVVLRPGVALDEAMRNEIQAGGLTGARFVDPAVLARVGNLELVSRARFT